MQLVIGSFVTIFEAEQTTRALLEAGHNPDSISAFGQVGAGRLLLAGKVGVQPVGDPARLVSRGDRLSQVMIAGALIGIVIAAVVLFAAAFWGWEPQSEVIPGLQGWAARGVVVVLAALLGGLINAAVRGRGGLPNNLASRYGSRLRHGDTVIGVRVPKVDQARAAQAILEEHGAVFAHLVSGTIEPIDPVDPPSLAER